MNEPTVKFARALAAMSARFADAPDDALMGDLIGVERAEQIVFGVFTRNTGINLLALADDAVKATRAEEAAADKRVDRGVAAMKAATCCKGTPLAAALGDALPAYGPNEHARVAAKIEVDLHPELPHCTDPRFVETGEVRMPRKGEWLANSGSGRPIQPAGDEWTLGPRRILRRVEESERGVAEEPERFDEATGPMPEGGGA